MLSDERIAQLWQRYSTKPAHGDGYMSRLRFSDAVKIAIAEAERETIERCAGMCKEIRKSYERLVQQNRINGADGSRVTVGLNCANECITAIEALKGGK